ncbi:MAG: methyl-accepting chemotaxis protein [Deltaproteobacteria bacterium]|nr:methyl-accepting chemotaxis protein [Deltaproteobacteria bacterium]
MNLQSMKTRFVGSYVVLLVLFIIQIPIIYMLVEGMSKKYAHVNAAGGLRKRAVEITEVLTRHVMTGDESLEAVFQTKREEYGQAIEGLRKGSQDVSAVKGVEINEKLDAVEKAWLSMRESLDNAMAAGDNLRTYKKRVEDTTQPMVDKMTTLLNAYNDLHDAGYAKTIEFAAQRRALTVRLSYLFERYYLWDYDGTVKRDMDSSIEAFDSGLDALKNGSLLLGIRPPKGEKVNAALREVDFGWKERRELMLAAVKAKDTFGANIDTVLKTHTPAVMAVADTLTKTITMNAKSDAMKSVMLVVISIIISAAIALIFMWSTNKLVIKPIIRIKETVEDFASGDLTKRAEVKISFMGKELNDEISSLGDSVDAMATQMSGLIGRIADSANQLASASEQLSASSTQISEGANKQSNQTTQVATAMEEMNATVIEVAKNSQQVAESAKSAQDIAGNGGDVVRQAIQAMQEVAESTSVTADTIKRLGKSSEEIGTIVSVINDIADQTNLLALNAAIEAARAGEQGRGFAVVADEVRKLAERTTKATKEISGMIRSIQDETTHAVSAMADGTAKVENGVRLANEAGDSLGKIVVGVQSVSDMIAHIATSTEEQSATTDEISKNMDSISEVSKMNVAAIGEVSKATNDMARLASELKDMVSSFRISRDSSGSQEATHAGKVIPHGKLLAAAEASGLRPRRLSAERA